MRRPNQAEMKQNMAAPEIRLVWLYGLHYLWKPKEWLDFSLFHLGDSDGEEGTFLTFVVGVSRKV